MTCNPATVAVLAPAGIVLAATPGGSVTVPATLSAGVPPIFAKLTVAPMTTLMEALVGTLTRVVTSAGNNIVALAVLLARLVSAVVVVTNPLKV